MNKPLHISRITLPPPHGQAAVGPLSALEAGLQGHDADTVRQEAVGKLVAIEQRLRQSMAVGCPPSEFAVLVTATDACVAARELVQRYSHPS